MIPGETVEPDIVRIPNVLARVIDAVLEKEQSKTHESTRSIRRRYKQEQIDAVAAWAARKQAEVEAV